MLGLPNSILRYQGWNFSKPTITLRSNLWEKNSKIYPLGIIKTLLLYHFKQISWQSMHKWRSFRTSKFTLMISGLNFFKVHKHINIQFLEKVKWNSKIYLLGIMETFLIYHLKQTSWNPCMNEEVLGLQRSLLRSQGWNFSKSTSRLK